MNVDDLLKSAECCYMKDCKDCPRRSENACREIAMAELAREVRQLQRMAVRQSVEMADALRDLLTVCENPAPTVRLKKARKWSQWMTNKGEGRK